MKKLVFVLVGLLAFTRMYSQTILTGKVIEKSTQAPLVGANVYIKGTQTGVITDLDGNFTIETELNSGTAVFSFISFMEAEKEFSGSMEFTVELEEDAVALEGVMVIGYGTVEKEDLSTAVSSLSGIEAMKSRAADTEGLLQGNIAGVNVMNSGGDPDANPSIIIRGLGSPSDQPLWVVDGVPGAPVNMSDIATITVLKDAASAAIYGANVGSGGVIVVTTKQAKAGKVRVSANYFTGLQQAARLPEALNAEEFNRIKNLAADNAGTARIEAFDASKNPRGGITQTDWVDEIFRVGRKERFALSLSGGTDRINALASVEVNNNEGILLNTFKKSLNGKLNVNFRLSDRINVTQWLQAGTSRGYSNDTKSGYTGAVISAIYMPPSASVYDKEGNFGGVVADDLLKYAGAYGDIVNPVATLKRKDLYNPSYTFHSTTKAKVTLWDGLSFLSAFTASAKQNLSQEFTPKRPEPGKPNEENKRTLSSAFSNRWLWENTITYDKMFGKHALNVVAGYSASYAQNRGYGLSVYGFDNESDYLRHLTNGSDWSKSKPSEQRSELAAKSTFSRLSYVYANKYFLVGSVRYDATSKLFKDNNDGTFPSMSAAWKISGEDFFNVSFINLLKLRASWGQIGNVSSVNNYSSSVALAASRSSLFGSTAQLMNGLGMSTYPNYALTWETSEQTDFGIDLDLFNSKVNIVADYYIKYTKDFIDKQALPSTSGAMSDPLGNIGKVKNEGYEFAVSYGDTKRDFTYRVGANLAYSKNEVQNLGDRKLYDNNVKVRGVLNPVYSSVGQAWHSYYLIKTDGIFQTDEAVQQHVSTDGKVIQPNAKAGDLKFIDRNNDGLISGDDREFMGSAVPQINYGFSAYLEYKGFDLSVLLQGVGKAKIFNAFKSTTLTASEQGYNMSRDILDAWSSSNTSSSIPRISAVDPNKNFQTNSDWFLEDGSYLRVKNITLGYSLPKSLMNRIKLPQGTIRMYVSGENILTLTKYTGMDPEVGNYGVDVGAYPVSRIFSFGANINF